LPPSPPTWEVDGRDEFQREYNDPAIRHVFQAGFRNQHTKVVKLAAALSVEQRQGKIEGVIAKAYRKLIIQRMKSGQLAAAAKQGQEKGTDLFSGIVREVGWEDSGSIRSLPGAPNLLIQSRGKLCLSVCLQQSLAMNNGDNHHHTLFHPINDR
jgi:hypothetical protein